MAIGRSTGGENEAEPFLYRIEPLTKDHERADFRSGKEPLDRFIRDQVFDWIGRKLAQVYVLVSSDRPHRVLGYYTLSMTRIDAGDLPAVQARRFPHSAEIGAALLGKLAVDESHQGRRLGRDLLFDALDRTLAAAEQVAAYAMVVDAIDEDAAAFYRRHGFLAFPETPERLFLDLRTHAKRVAAARGIERP